MDGSAGAGASPPSAGGPGSIDAGSFVADALTRAGILDPETARAYASLFSRYMAQQQAAAAGARSRHGAGGLLSWDRIRPPTTSGLVLDYADLEPCPPDEPLQHELLRKVAIVKLNGGLGSTMGCEGPKSCIPVRSGLTFLDLTVRQVEYLNAKWGTDVPLILMNSFRTHDETVKILQKYQHHNVTITCFVQSSFPRIDADHFTPLPTGPFRPSDDDDQAWYPPGHGDVYRALDKSGVLDALLAAGKEFVFISNVDNLGATADLRVLYHLVSNPDVDFAMEVTERTKGDVQGGVLIEYADTAAAAAAAAAAAGDGSSSSSSAASPSTAKPARAGHAKLLELAHVPEEHTSDFKSLKTFTMFNTNNIWVSLKAMKALLAADAIQPPVIVGSKKVRGNTVLELETAAGAAIEFFSKAVGIRVPRSRFLPVKSTSDLLAVQSNLFDVRHGSLVQSQKREAPNPPVIKLGPEFADLEAYTARAGGHVPDILDLDHLTVSGDVFFGKGVVLRGTVIIVATQGSRIDIPPGTVLEDKVVTGHLRILEH
jgi:UTP--glucose-1-phosphate uridylyltransferase